MGNTRLEESTTSKEGLFSPFDDGRDRLVSAIYGDGATAGLSAAMSSEMPTSLIKITVFVVKHKTKKPVPKCGLNQKYITNITGKLVYAKCSI